MSNKNNPPDEPEDNNTTSPINFRWYWLRTALLTVLIFIFVMWYTYPSNGAIAILWSAGLAGLVLGYFVFSYYKLYR